MITRRPGDEDHPRRHADPPAHAPRADLSPRVRKLLEGLRELALAHFPNAILCSLEEADHAFFQLAEHAPNSARQQAHFDGLRELRRGRADVAPRFLQNIEATFARVRATPEPTPRTEAAFTGTLELVDSAVLDEDLAFQEVVGKSEIRHSHILNALAHRLGVIAGTPACPLDALPLGPARLMTAFREALHPIELDVEHRVIAYRQFDRMTMLPIAAFYEKLDAYLIAQRVLPNLQTSNNYRRGDSTREAFAEQAGSQAAPEPETAETAPSGASANGDPSLFATLRSLLGERRRFEGGELPDQAASPDVVATQGDVQSILGALQRNPGARGASAYDAEHFRNTLLVKLRRASPAGRPLQLAQEDSDTVDLVGMLFGHLTQSLREGSGTVDLLTRLHVPVLRVALGDKSFFTRRDHPARKLLNTIAETAVHWTDGDDADPDLVRKMQVVVDHVSQQFDGDVGVFESLLGDLDKHMQLLARRAEVTERRHVDAARGRDKLDIARNVARNAITRVLQQGSASPMARSLLEHAWTDALALSALRDGENGTEFRRRLAVAETLARRDAKPGAEHDEALIEDIDTGLRQVGMHDDDVRGVLDHLFPAPDATPVAAPEPHRLDAALREHTRLGGGDDHVDAAAPSQPALSDTERETLEHLHKMPFGTWFEFVTNQQGQFARRKLAWFSPMTGRCLFVNQRGGRTANTTLDQLARDMVRGQARVAVAESTSLIDRAWNAILTSLRLRPAPTAEVAST